MNDDQPIEQQPTPKEQILKYNNWVKKNWFTMVGIIIILGLVLFEIATVESDKVKISNECNKHWYAQVAKVCPALINDNTPKYELISNLSIDS